MKRLFFVILLCLPGCVRKDTIEGCVGVHEVGDSLEADPNWCPYCGEWDEPHCVGMMVSFDTTVEQGADGELPSEIQSCKMYCSNCRKLFRGKFVH